MYDFCITPIYAALLALGGIIGWATRGSTASLASGLGSAALLALLSYISLQHYQAGKLCRPATLASLVISAALAWVMYMRSQRTGKFMPAGLVSVISILVSIFYIWNLTLFKPNLPAKQS